MGKIIIARTDDKGNKRTARILILFACVLGGCCGIPAGSVLHIILMVLLRDASTSIEYFSFTVAVIAGILIALYYALRNTDTKDHTICEKCGHQMVPMTEADALFAIPATTTEEYDDPFHYLAHHMVRISAIREIPKGRRGCFVCCYACRNCNNRITRISDFFPENGTCNWKNTYYYDMHAFETTRNKNDLL